MDSERDARRSLEQYRLRTARETGLEFGRGSYAAVVQVDYKGLRCAGKKIHRVLYEGHMDNLVRRFEEECRLLSQLRHPHVVQFLGIYFEEDTNAPVLVMEFLPTTLTQCLDRYGIMPEEINYSILQDVAIGLRYLHDRDDPIVHRDLSANNVLLTPDMKAKISDLGVAKILEADPTRMSPMTTNPGTQCYMPPEATADRPRYDAKVDIFSYGVMIVHVLSGQWPFPGEANRINPNAPNDLVGVTEFDRREKYINHIGKQHPLMKLIQLCLSNCPSHRPTSSEVHQQVSTVATDHPPSFANRVEMLERIKALGEEKEAMKIEKNNAIAEKNEQITEREQISSRLEKTQSNMDRLQELHSIELEGIHITNYDLKADNEHLQVILKAKEREFDLILSSKDALISSKSSTIQHLQEKLGQALGTLSRKDSLNVFSPGAKVSFTESAELSISGDIPGQAIVVRKNVYVVIGDKNVLKYSIIEDSWSTLPETPVIYFSIAYLCMRIMLAGGQLSANNQVMGDIHEFDESSQQWVRSTSIPPMPTARKLTTAVSWTSPTALIVCGGSDEHCKPVNVVEVYHSRTSQWHAVSTLPFPRDWMTHSVIHNVLYLVGGYEKSAPETYTKTVLSASIPQLLESCLQPSMTPPVQWQSLSIPDIPNHWSTAASFGGCLLVVGGNSIPRLSLGSKFSSVHAYCPSSSSWVLVGELPQPLAGCIAATLPTGELLVTGGLTSEGKWSTTNYKCCLSMQTCIY